MASQTKTGVKFLNVYKSGQGIRILNKRSFELDKLVELNG